MKIPIASDGHVMSADDFFQTIMKLTNTEIRYPKSLKVGARNKKDPYVRVIGYPGAVQEASGQIRNDLQPHNKITMKLDVSWACHSYIIGKSGNTIQPVVKRTGVSIHFPDGNKNSNEVKSNQVSINSRGEDIRGLEEARSAIRDLTPLTFNFSLPANTTFIRINDHDFSLFIDRVHSTYNVKVELQYKEGDQPIIFGSVKGTENDSNRVMEATVLVLRSLCREHSLPQISVQMTMEISQQFHACMTSRNSECLKKITLLTTTRIEFDYTVDKEKLQWCHLIISGSIHNVYVAKQKIIGSLPLVVMFDLMPSQPLDQAEADLIMQRLDIHIMIKNKRIDGRRSIVLKGPERIASKIYEAWLMITKSDKILPQVKIPKSYFLDDISPYMEISKKKSCPISMNNNEAMTNMNQQNSFHNLQSSFITELPENGVQSVSAEISQIPGQISEPFQLSEFGHILNLIPDRRAPGCERKQFEKTEKNDVTDYFAKKMQAFKVMKQPVSQTPRTPTSDWSGFGLSKSVPHFAMKLKKEKEISLNDWNGWNLNASGASYESNNEDCQSSVNMATANNDVGSLIQAPSQMSDGLYMDSLRYRPMSIPESVTPDLSGRLAQLQLERYIDLFEFNNITMANINKLSDQDLKNIGVDCFGHRRRILMMGKN